MNKGIFHYFLKFFSILSTQSFVSVSLYRYRERLEGAKGILTPRNLYKIRSESDRSLPIFILLRPKLST